MKQNRIKRIIMCVLAFVTLFAFSNIASAYTSSITGVQFSYNGTSQINFGEYTSHEEITSVMSPGGYLYGTNTKAVALRGAKYDTVDYIDRVRVYPENSSSDLRIDVYASGNWVGVNQANYSKQVKGVQTILKAIGYNLGSSGVDGACGQKTIAAIQAFQRAHNLPDDGVVGPNSWRALCSSSSYWHGYSIF